MTRRTKVSDSEEKYVCVSYLSAVLVLKRERLV